MKRTFHKMKRMNPILCKVLSIIALASLFLLLFPKKPTELGITMEAGDGLDHSLPSSEHFIFLLASTFLLTLFPIEVGNLECFSRFPTTMEGLLWASTVVSNGSHFEKEKSQVQRNYMQNQF